MIQQNELRIGNLIDDGYGNPLTVTSINERMVCSDNWGFEYESAEPILLTPDILLKCGFAETINNRDSGYKQIGKNIGGHDFMFTIECNHQPEFYFDMVGVDIIYLHQLQNLYHALTFEELEITDLKRINTPTNNC